ncbi:MAG: aminoacyl-tRNA hydrolase, partial [Deltaproteobacteria bacterium]|nr:aminoacyl-tRNA hydrolase [Deltaproteobacteria bacterium]
EAWGDWNGEEVFLVKPRTYMNNSGVAVKSLLDEKKGSPADLILIHDDLDLPLEKLRWGFQSGHGGHNGVRSVIEKLETKDFHRLRLGIGRPHGRQEPADYVLEPFTGEDLAAAERMTIEAVKAVHEFLNKLLLKGEADEKI